MLHNEFFYNRTIRKIVVAFGTIFNDLQIIRFTKAGVEKERIRVPLSYGAKEKYMTRLLSDPDLLKSVNTVVPRISFDMTGMAYDPSRKQITTAKNFATNNSTTTLKSQRMPVPYTFDFSMSIYVRNTEDGTQILEQILPFFTPDYTVTVKFIPSMGDVGSSDMPITLNSVSNEVDYEGDMASTRLIIWNLEFTARSYIWPAIKEESYIRNANANVYIETTTTSNVTTNNLTVIFHTESDNAAAMIDDEFGFADSINYLV
jgi:hypothetical protein